MQTLVDRMPFVFLFICSASENGSDLNFRLHCGIALSPRKIVLSSKLLHQQLHATNHIAYLDISANTLYLIRRVRTIYFENIWKHRPTGSYPAPTTVPEYLRVSFRELPTPTINVTALHITRPVLFLLFVTFYIHIIII